MGTFVENARRDEEAVKMSSFPEHPGLRESAVAVKQPTTVSNCAMRKMMLKPGHFVIRMEDMDGSGRLKHPVYRIEDDKRCRKFKRLHKMDREQYTCTDKTSKWCDIPPAGLLPVEVVRRETDELHRDTRVWITYPKKAQLKKAENEWLDFMKSGEESQRNSSSASVVMSDDDTEHSTGTPRSQKGSHKSSGRKRRISGEKRSPAPKPKNTRDAIRSLVESVLAEMISTRKQDFSTNSSSCEDLRYVEEQRTAVCLGLGSKLGFHVQTALNHHPRISGIANLDLSKLKSPCGNCSNQQASCQMVLSGPVYDRRTLSPKNDVETTADFTAFLFCGTCFDLAIIYHSLQHLKFATRNQCVQMILNYECQYKSTAKPQTDPIIKLTCNRPMIGRICDDLVSMWERSEELLKV